MGARRQAADPPYARAVASLRLAELLSGLSLATDLAIGAPLETSLRTSLVATRLGARAGLVGPILRDVYYAALLRHLGCTAWAHEAAALHGGDDHDIIRTFEGVDRGRRSAVLARAVGLAKGQSSRRRLRAVVGVLARPGAADALVTAQCAQARALAEDLELGVDVVTALGQIYERHDGRGAPHRLRGDGISPVARFVIAGQLVEVLHRRLGRDGALAELVRRRGGDVAPDIMDLAVADAPELWPLLEEPVLERFLDAEPAPQLTVIEERLATIARAFGRFVDLKTPHTVGHSPAVSALAAQAGRVAGWTQGEIASVETAGLLHDLGAVSVANGVWERPGPLGAAAWERVRLHAYYSERILARAALTAPLAAIAGGHHERPDGSGYHRGARGEAISRGARFLGAADSFVALRERRPYRDAYDDEHAARIVSAEAKEGRLCRDAVAAVLAAAGNTRGRPALPAGLSEREVEVLGHIARGLSSKQIAILLGIAQRTVKHHIEHIYAKTGVSTRAAAALYAVRRDLV